MVRRLLLVLVAVAVAGWSAPPVQGADKAPVASTMKAAEAKVNLNKATAAELATLPGIGEVTAKSIVDFRQSNGSFRTVDDLVQVKGIGEKKLEALRSLVTVE